MLPGQPRWLLVPGLVQCRAGPVWVEPCRLAHNPEVAGSNPAPTTKPAGHRPEDDLRACLPGSCNRLVNARRAAARRRPQCAARGRSRTPPDARLRAHAALRPRRGQARWMPVNKRAGPRKHGDAARPATPGVATGRDSGSLSGPGPAPAGPAVAGPDNGSAQRPAVNICSGGDLTANTAAARLAIDAMVTIGAAAGPSVLPLRLVRARPGTIAACQAQCLPGPTSTTPRVTDSADVGAEGLRGHNDDEFR